MSKKIKSVCIVGGGSSGWMTAATFATQFPKMDVTIIESPDFPILGVGESTLGGIKHWTSLIGLEDKDFLKENRWKLQVKYQIYRLVGARTQEDSTIHLENIKDQ